MSVGSTSPIYTSDFLSDSRTRKFSYDIPREIGKLGNPHSCVGDNRSAMPKVLTTTSFRLFLLLDRLGLHALPKHYYTPVPDYDWLKKNKQAWIGRTDLTGVHWDLDEQLEWLAQICAPYYHEVAGLEFFKQTTASAVGPGFGPIESQVLHCFIRANAPNRIVEIGSGVSTACM